MPFRESLSFEFATEGEQTILTRTTLRTEGGIGMAENGRGGRQFAWGRTGPQAMALLFVRLARWKGIPQASRPDLIPLIVGTGRPSMAASIGDALMAHSLKWIAAMFDVGEPPSHGTALARLRRWFEFENIQGKRCDQTMTISAKTADLPPEAIEIVLDGQPIEGAQLDKLERRLAARLDGSLPPFAAGTGTAIKGYLPSVSAANSGRSSILRELDLMFADEQARICILVGGAGTGKTTTAMEWIAARSMRGNIGLPLIFGWSFYRQGYGIGSQSLTEFFTSLAEALKVEICDSMLPLEIAEAIHHGLSLTPALILLDGLEVLLDFKGPNVTGVSDAALDELLVSIACATQPFLTKVLITSRRPLRSSLRSSPPEVLHLKMGSFDMAMETPEAGLLTTTPLEWTIAMGQCAGQAEATRLLVTLSDSGGEDCTPKLVRHVLEALGDSPARTLLLATSLFDRPPEWSALSALLQADPPIAKLTDKWSKLPQGDWETALELLQHLHLCQKDASGCVVVHPHLIQCLANEFRTSMPAAWAAAQCWLFEYFAAQPDRYLPETILEMEPLWRSTWHACQAGEYRRSYEQVGFPRISRGTSAWLLYELGAYSQSLSSLECYSPDHTTFPAGCDLDPEQRVLILMAIGWCLQYLDRLEEGYETCSSAMNRLTTGCTPASVMPALTQMLMWQYLFGDLDQSGPILRRMMKCILTAPFTTQKLEASPALVMSFTGLTGSLVATALWRQGRTLRAQVVLKMTLAACSRMKGAQVLLAPGLGSPWHALLLLDMGRWQDVERALEAGDLDEGLKRHRETAMPQLIRGRVLSAKARFAKNQTRTMLASEALATLQSGLKNVERLRFRWQQCAFHLAIAELHLGMSRQQEGAESAEACYKLATNNRFKLMETDALKLLSQSRALAA